MLTQSSSSGNLYDGSALAAFGDVVVVTINYRLGVFGEASLGVTLYVMWGRATRYIYYMYYMCYIYYMYHKLYILNVL